jgi:hypothetical protein
MQALQTAFQEAGLEAQDRESPRIIDEEIYMFRARTTVEPTRALPLSRAFSPVRSGWLERSLSLLERYGYR